MQQSAVLFFFEFEDSLQGLFPILRLHEPAILRAQVFLTLPTLPEQLLFSFCEGPQYTGSAASSMMYTNKQQNNIVAFNFNRCCFYCIAMYRYICTVFNHFL